ncbi:MAG: hypothetical protein GYA14_01365, partial [Ignavibacteria bacterium]|nr:hypothetical protein [Ignavibacteria bacterium]
MQNNFANHRYWILAAIIIVGLIIILYPLTPYESLNMNITRSEAIHIAKDFLKEQNENVDNMYVEVFLDNSPVEARYILKKLGGKEFKEYGKNELWSNLSWTVYFHQNLPRNIQQKSITVDVSNNGKVFGFNKILPDSIPIASINKNEATSLVSSYLKNKIGDDFEKFKMTESREENIKARTDYSFRWEKDEVRLNAKIIITARVLGNKVGSFSYYFEVPQQDREYFLAIEAIYGTVSVI